jgi:hypothetical protein
VETLTSRGWIGREAGHPAVGRGWCSLELIAGVEVTAPLGNSDHSGLEVSIVGMAVDGSTKEEVPAMGRGCLATTGPHTVLAGRGQTEGQTLGHLFAKFSPSEVRALPEQVKTIPILLTIS